VQLHSQAVAIAATLRQRWADCLLWLFGSVLGPGLHADSDLDHDPVQQRLSGALMLWPQL